MKKYIEAIIIINLIIVVSHVGIGDSSFNLGEILIVILKETTQFSYLLLSLVVDDINFQWVDDKLQLAVVGSSCIFADVAVAVAILLL